ncbi:MAG TPA: hypothetical protein VHE34_08625 [Puia sp.]|uniref:hypothetical protein n=1 Tax=Puia sp. TaxID=2045100 RepID=UPI002B727B1B|nr:hypothetical protein [Puia sp.]HVU95274.1 hypothetical protein [Puia sp.]
MKTLSKAAILMAGMVAIFFVAWELHLRSRGFAISYDEGKELWADKRAKVYESPDRTTVFIGSSRIKYDLDIDTWKAMTGRNAVQLAMEGNSPLPILEDLAADPKFAGKVVCDAMEFVFFAGDNSPVRREQKQYIDYYRGRTPAQRASFELNHALESQLVFLDKDFLSLNGLMAEWQIANRPYVYADLVFPWSFQRVSFDRQDKMAPVFVADTNIQNQVKGIWSFMISRPPDTTGAEATRLAIIQRTVAAVDKIRARGGDVCFVRPPSSGMLERVEKMAMPRAMFWQALLDATHSSGVHYADDPATDHFICPEWSHLSPADAVLYTKALIRRLPESFVRKPLL